MKQIIRKFKAGDKVNVSPEHIQDLRYLIFDRRLLSLNKAYSVMSYDIASGLIRLILNNG